SWRIPARSGRFRRALHPRGRDARAAPRGARRMSRPIGLSKSKLLSFLQCPRRLWLEQHRPELAHASDGRERRFESGITVGDLARLLYGRGGGHLIGFDEGIAGAARETQALLARDDDQPIFEATFAHDGLAVRVDVLDKGANGMRIVEVKSSSRVKDEHLEDCAIQAYAATIAGHAPAAVAVAHVDTSFVYEGSGRYEGLIAEEDVTEQVRERLPE